MLFKPLNSIHSDVTTPQLSLHCCSNPSTQPTVMLKPLSPAHSVGQTSQLSPECCSNPSTQPTVLEFNFPVPCSPAVFQNPLPGPQSRSKPIYLAYCSNQNSSTGPTGCSNHLFPAHSVQLFMVHAINVIKRMLSIRLKHGER